MYKVSKTAKSTGDHFRLLKNARREKNGLGAEYHIYASENQGDTRSWNWYKLE